MATVKQELDRMVRGKGVLGLATDEPIFILRATDPIAAELVQLWEVRARAANVDHDKCLDARHVYEQFLEWPKRKLPD